MSLQESINPQGVLVPPPASGSSFADDLRTAAGPLIGRFDSLVQQLLGISLLEKLVDPFVGDWQGLERGVVAWQRAGDATAAVASNYAGVRGQLGEGWKGEASIAFCHRMTRVSEGYSDFADGCYAMSEVAAALLELARATAEAIASILGFIGDWLARVVMEQSIPVFGQLASMVDSGLQVGPLSQKVNNGTKLITKLLASGSNIAQIIQTLQEISEVLAEQARYVGGIIGDYRSFGGSLSASDDQFSSGWRGLDPEAPAGGKRRMTMDARPV